MTRIEKLKKLPPQARAQELQRLFDKNKAYFKRIRSNVSEILDIGSTAPFRIEVDDKFLKIVDKRTGALCHPEAGLDRFAEVLGDWTNKAWIELISGNPRIHGKDGRYSSFTYIFQRDMLQLFPGLAQRMKERSINLPTLQNGKRFSNSVIFAGIFHGLHIDYYLSRTQLINAALIEPDPARFVLSCYFLDYEYLSKRFSGLVLHVGDEFPETHIDNFFRKAAVTGPVWVRILPGYASEKVDPMLRQLRLKWRNVFDVWFPAEYRMQGMKNALENLEHKPLCAQKTVLPEGSRIAVIGSGPSLSNDLPWLEQHQDELIIFAAHSSVTALKSHGIKPDFQFNIEIRPWTREMHDRIQLDPEIPVVTMVNDMPDKFTGFKHVLMVAALGDVLPVKFNAAIPFIPPTTGNMALAFACYCQPERIYLFGLDFGFRHAEKTHVAESTVYQSKEAHATQLGSQQLPVPANFSESAEVFTQPYFNMARLTAQKAIKSVAGRVKVFNCADGARIEGATPLHSTQIELENRDKSGDVHIIRGAFKLCSQEQAWQPFEVEAEEQLDYYKKALKDQLKIGKFNWLKFACWADDFTGQVRKKMPKRIAAEHLDCRIQPYVDIIQNLLIAWYRLLCFTNTPDEWQKVYDIGYCHFTALLDQMEWEDLASDLPTDIQKK